HHWVIGQRGPDRAPGGHPQGGPAAPGDGCLALVAAGGVAAWAQASVLDQRPREVNRAGSPVSAKIAAAPAGVSPALVVTRPFSAGSPKGAPVRASARARRARVSRQSPRAR